MLNQTVKQTFRFTKALFKDTFRRGGAYRDEMLNVQRSLYTKSWLIHMIMMFSRVAYLILGIAYW